ncbi:MAG TPA: hypothetical protein PLG50_07630 [bacterium]|nr:hypothetical protein [bacterium]HQG45514.1 hypothetical protein [bacterium]HQI49982.1 hypothetical protein [bacterium]HQJ66042.1 hypothetical protein [bacterium]
MRHSDRLFVLVSLLVAVQWIILPGNSYAIPAFARRYNLSCSTCHAPIPKLKPYGAEFAGNGFIIPENEKERDYISAGDELLWLNKSFPVAVRFDAYAVHRSKALVENDLQSPWGIKLLSGGNLSRKIGYYFYFYMTERGEVSGIEDAYVHFDNVFGIPLDIMAGQFQTSDPLMKRELRLTYEDYQIYKQNIGFSRINLSYDRGLMFLYSLTATGTDLVLSLTNGNGKNMANEETGAFDYDNNKNLGLRLHQEITDKMSLGGYYYYGAEMIYGEGVSFKNKVTYIGPDFNATFGPFEFTGQYLYRKDTNPWLTRSGSETKTNGAVIEAIFSPQLDRSRYYLIALYNGIHQEASRSVGALHTTTSGTLYQTATLGATYLVQRNLRLTLEYTRDLERKANRAVLGLVSGF